MAIAPAAVRPSSKYSPLFDHLRTAGAAEVRLTFAEMATLLGRPLPASAAERKNCWSNHDSPTARQASAWVGACYPVHEVDLASKTVVFRKVEAQYPIQYTAYTNSIAAPASFWI